MTIRSENRTGSRRVDVLSINNGTTITDVAAPKGRRQRDKDGERALFANVGADVIARLDVGAAALNMSRGAYIEHLVREMPVNERGLPSWLAELANVEQLPLHEEEEPDRVAA